MRGSDPTTGPAERSPPDGGHIEKRGEPPSPGTQVRHGHSKAGMLFFSDAKWWTRGENTQAHTLPGSKPNAQEPSNRTWLDLQQQIKVLRPRGPRLGLGGSTPCADSRWVFW